jgi:hypothetical protein
VSPKNLRIIMEITSELDFVYICSDGKKFLDRKEAEKYEGEINSIVDHYNFLGSLERLVN